MGMIRNVPIPVEMAGWRSDTYALQQHGWQISAEQRIDMRTIQIVLHHPETKAYLMSMVEELDYFRMDRAEMLARMSMRVNQLPSGFMFQHHNGHQPFLGMMPVDATPHIVEMEKSSLEDLMVFRPLPKEELIVAPDTVPGLMDKIIALQDPKIKELIAEQRKRETRGEQGQPHKISNHCQIISIAS